MSDLLRARVEEAGLLFKELTKNWTDEERLKAFEKLRPLFEGEPVQWPVEIPIPERLQMVEEE